MLLTMMSSQATNKLKNICMISTHGYFDPVPKLGQTDTGGQVVYILQLAKALTANDIKVDIYTRWFDHSKKQIDPLPDCPDVRVIRIPGGQWKFIPKEEIYAVLPQIANNMITFIHDNNINYDLFHGHYVDGGIVTLKVAEEFSRDAFFTAHSLGAWKRDQMGGEPNEMDRKYNFKLRISEEQRIFKTVKAQTVTTEIQKEIIKKLYGLKLDNITVIPPGVDINRFKPSKSGEERIETGFPNRYILCLSRIDTNKGHDLLLNAFDIVSKKFPDIHLVIGGGSPETTKREQEILSMLHEIAEKKNMKDRVHIVGYVPDSLMASSYQNAELFVLPSIFEPFGMTALEAMACGTPVVASKLGGIREVITHGKNGLLVDPTNANEFANAIIMLLQNKKLLSSMELEARKSVQDCYSWDAIARRHIQFYNNYGVG
jgi:mannosylfructose-phosphate synthase